MIYMLNFKAHARPRLIKKVETQTPLIVPSFSSRGFPHVAEIFEELKGHLFGVCLISASDLSEGLMPPDSAAAANVVVVDSGRYEHDNSAFDYSECSIPPSTSEWSRPMYHMTIRAVSNDVANGIVVNYDRCADMEVQIESANEDFIHVPAAA